MRALPLLLLLTLANGPIQWSTMSRGQRVMWLHSVADQCKIPRSALALRENDGLHFKPKADTKYENVDCALQALRGIHASSKIGFVTSERYVDQ